MPAPDEHLDEHLNEVDFAVIGSGFGGSVSALRLAEKGYSVAVLEKGRRFTADDFPPTNWHLRRWLWAPLLNWFGPFKMTFFRHVTVFSGVGVGGGSLVYANTLPIPGDGFFKAKSWAHLADWRTALAPYYPIARRMLGAVPNPHMTRTDSLMREVARDLGVEDKFGAPHVAIYFGEPGVVTPDPFFDGAGPERKGCILCGACMTGCRHGAKNTLDKNYLYLAEKRGARIEPNCLVEAIRPEGGGGYRLELRHRLGWRRSRTSVLRARQVVLAGGVLGTLELLLKMRADPRGLPHLSPTLGTNVRTNNESILGVLTPNKHENFANGIAISSIIQMDEHSHVEPVRYGEGSGFFRLLLAPHAPGFGLAQRLTRGFWELASQPIKWARAASVPDFSRQSQILLYMRSLDDTLRLVLKRRAWRGFRTSMGSRLSPGGHKPSAYIPEATDFARRFAKKVDGVVGNVLSETLFGIASTAHLLGGCCMGRGPDEGVIDHQHRVFGYNGLYVIDGSAMSANPGVNPSLTITALAERAMDLIPARAAEPRPVGAAGAPATTGRETVEDHAQPARST